MLSVRIAEPLAHQLDTLAKSTHRSKSFYVNKALEAFLEDRADYLMALAALEDGEPAVSWAEAKKVLDQLHGD